MTAATPAPFTAVDYEARMRRAADAAADAGLDGVLVAPGPDMVWLTGYRPVETERLTLLVLRAGQDPALVVPTLEAPDAAKSTGAPALTLHEWTDGTNPYEAAAPSSPPPAASASATTAGRCTCSACRNGCPTPGTRP